MSPCIWMTPGMGAMAWRSTATILASFSPLSSPLKLDLPLWCLPVSRWRQGWVPWPGDQLPQSWPPSHHSPHLWSWTYLCDVSLYLDDARDGCHGLEINCHNLGLLLTTLLTSEARLTFVMSPCIWMTPGMGAMAWRSTATILASFSPLSSPLKQQNIQNIKTVQY